MSLEDEIAFSSADTFLFPPTVHHNQLTVVQEKVAEAMLLSQRNYPIDAQHIDLTIHFKDCHQHLLFHLPSSTQHNHISFHRIFRRCVLRFHQCVLLVDGLTRQWAIRHSSIRSLFYTSHAVSSQITKRC